MTPENSDVTNQEYFFEILVLILATIAFVCLKIFVCCNTLGLAQKFKKIQDRNDPLSKAELFNLRSISLEESTNKRGLETVRVKSDRTDTQVSKESKFVQTTEDQNFVGLCQNDVSVGCFPASKLLPQDLNRQIVKVSLHMPHQHSENNQ